MTAQPNLDDILNKMKQKTMKNASTGVPETSAQKVKASQEGIGNSHQLLKVLLLAFMTEVEPQDGQQCDQCRP